MCGLGFNYIRQMADNLIFPIRFDLQQAVEKAGQEWDKTYAKKLEAYLAKRPVRVKLDFEKLEDVKTRLAQLKIEPITPETKAAIKELAKELQTLAKALEQVQKYSRNPTKGAVDTSKVQLNEQRAKAQAELAAQRAAKAEDNLAAARLKDARAANVGTSATHNANKAYAEQSSYLTNLLKKTAALWSIHRIGSFLTNVRYVTAQFELQRVSLGAIIQDQQRANALFSEIKSFALKSPVSIMDLTKYTKQLAAYKIETEELFETTKKLTDVSVGLGVSMDRVVLAYGQTRATGYLRASEIRQFTEMGVPIVEELAEKLSKLNGETVTAAQVMDMVSKRAISFEMVKEVFDDMTSAGGMFYNMQEEQGNTLFGLWAKLGDAASVMYDQIGNTEWVNNGMKAAIGLLTEFMRNWKAVGAALSVEAVGAGIYLLVKKSIQKGASIEAEKVAAATRNRARAQAELNTQLKIGTQADIAAARAALQKAKADEQAAISASKNVTTKDKLKTGLLSLGKSLAKGLGIGIVISLASTLIYKIADAIVNANRLKNALSDISAETEIEISRMVTNFESLANKAVKAADGSKEQKEALSELQRTYRNIIPEQELTIKKLREMKGEYSNLTIAIREYIREQQMQKGLNEIYEEHGKKVLEEQKELEKRLKSTSFTSGTGEEIYLDENQIGRIVKVFKQLVIEGKSAQQALKTAFQYEGIDHLVGNYDKLANDLGLIKKYQVSVLRGTIGDGFRIEKMWVDEGVRGLTKALQDQIKAENDWKKQMDDTVPTMGALTKYFEDAKKKIEEHTFAAKENTLAFDVETAKVNIDAYLEALKNALDASGIKIDLNKFIVIDEQGIKNFDFEAFNKVISGIDSQFKVPLINLTGEIKKIYDGFVPSDPVAKQIRAKFFEIANGIGDAGNLMKNYLWDGQEALQDNINSLGDAITEYEAEIYRMKVAIAMGGAFGNLASDMFADRIEMLTNLVQGLKEIRAYEKKYIKPENNKKGTGGSKSDNRLQNLQEIEQTLTKINQKYDELAKKEGQTKAIEDINKLYGNTLKYVNELGKQFKLSFKMPTEFKDLQDYRKAILDVINELRMKGYEKAALDLEEKIGTGNLDVLQKDIEKQLNELSDRISRTKTAKEFYEKILGMTGDVELAANVSLQIYGSTGKELSEQIKEQFRLAFATLDKPDAKVSAKIGDLIDKGRFEELRDYIELLPESQRKAAEDLVKAQQQMSVKQYEQWLKDLEKAKDYADKRIELSRYTANQIAAIEERIAKLNPMAADYEQQKAMLEKLIAGYKSREVKMGAELDYEQFKNSALYVQVFENLDNASKTALENMRNRLIALKDQWQNLSPEKVKELTKRLEELDAQIAQRNPFKSIADSIKKLREMRMSGRTKEGDAKKAFDAEEDRKVAKANMLLDEKAYEAAVKQYGAESNIAKEKRKIADESAEAYRNSEKAADRAAENADEWKNVEEAINSANQKIDKYQEQINEALDGVRKMMEAFGASDEDMQFFDDVVGSLNEIVDAGQQAVTATANIMSGNPAQMFQGITQGVSAIGGIVSGFSNLFSAGKVKKANKEIKRQQQILEQLEYTYSRLEAKADKLFGRDYINNFKKQQENLEAQARAYKAQADAERSKGKKADEGKIKEYENAYRETMDKIADMQGKLAEQMTGSDIASSARDFANAWLEAYASFGNTAGAIKDKFKDMIKNMVIESVLAQTVQRSLQPMFDKIDEMYKQGASMTSVLAYAFEESNRRAEEINNALTIAAHRAEQAGVKLRGLTGSSSDFSGISRDIASASEESINGLAAGVNTQNYYMSYTPRIYDEVAALRAMFEKSYLGSTMSYHGGIDYTDIINISNQHLSSLPSIEANTAQTVKELQEVIGILRRVTIPKGGSAAYGVNVYMRN